MAILTPAFKSTTFASVLDITVDLTGADGLLVQVLNVGASNTPINSVVVDPAGVNITLTAETEQSASTLIGISGRVRAFKYVGSLPQTSVTIRVTLNDGNCKPHVWVQPISGYSAISAMTTVTGGSTSVTAAVASATGRTVLSFLFAADYLDTSTITGTGTTSVLRRVLRTDGGSNTQAGAILSTPGQASASVTATGSTTFGQPSINAWSLTPAAAAADLGGNVTLADATPGGGLSSVASSLGGAVTLDDAAPAGTLGAAPGRIRLLGAADEWRDKAGSLLASLAATVDVHSAATGAQLARITTATDAAGLLPEISHAALGQSTLYRIDVLFTTGQYGVVCRTSEAT